MDDNRSFQRLAATAAILSAPLAVGNLALGLAAVGFNLPPGAFSDPGAVMAIGAVDARLLRWSLVCDLFGYYLLLAPLALLLGSWLRPQSPNLIRLYTYCGLAYVLVGAIGAAMFGAVAPPLIAAYAQAVGTRREILEVVFTSFVNMVVNGLWNPLEMILGSVWWLGIGQAVWRDRPAFGILSSVLGGCALLDAGGQIFDIAAIFAIGLGGALLLIPIWALYIGIDLLRRPAGALPGELAAREMIQ